MMLSTLPLLIPRLRMCGDIPPTPRYADMLWHLISHEENLSIIQWDII
jgi:hypothetical protein